MTVIFGGDYLDLAPNSILDCQSWQGFLPHSWIFDVFDEDGGGTIELDEVIKLVGAKNLKKKKYWTHVSLVLKGILKCNAHWAQPSSQCKQ